MGKPDSGYRGVERDHYPTTPPWPLAAFAEDHGRAEAALLVVASLAQP
jgi:hypothetical protein